MAVPWTFGSGILGRVFLNHMTAPAWGGQSLMRIRIADKRPAWSCAKRNPFSEDRWRSYWELPWVSRSRMAMTAASIADAHND